jgi:NAD(P)-dependent dehydrogenase (short-subunit alcohol dehydrogenase family)
MERVSMLIPDLFSVADKVALVTGGTSGIGAMIAEGLLANGARVYISSRSEERAATVARRLGDQHGGDCRPLHADLTSMKGVDSLSDQLSAEEPTLDILVNNAGATWQGVFDTFPEVGWDSVMAVNAKAPFFLTQRLLPLLEAAGTAECPSRVINIGSVSAFRTSRFDNYSYGPSKAAINAVTQLLAARLIHRNILVNAIAAGPFPSPMLGGGITPDDPDATDWDMVGAGHPRGRLGTPEDIAGTVIYLSSRAGAYVSGAIVSCDGGALVRR